MVYPKGDSVVNPMKIGGGVGRVMAGWGVMLAGGLAMVGVRWWNTRQKVGVTLT